MNWNAFFNVLMILVSIILMAAVLLQNRSSGAGSIFGQQTTVFRTRRGLEKILYRATIGLSVVFVITALASVRAHTPTTPTLNDLNIPGSSLPVAPAPELPAQPAPSSPDAAQPPADQSAAPADGSQQQQQQQPSAQPAPPADAPAPAPAQ